MTRNLLPQLRSLHHEMFQLQVLVSADVEDARPAQVPSKSKPSMSKPPARPIANGHVERNKVSTNRPVQTKMGHSKVGPLNKPDCPSADPRKLLGSNVGNGLAGIVDLQLVAGYGTFNSLIISPWYKAFFMPSSRQKTK